LSDQVTLDKENNALLNLYAALYQFEVVYRPNERVGWGRNRKIYDGKFDLAYNHRSILPNEVVFDFDSEDTRENEVNALEVMARLQEDGATPRLFSTGNKGYHIHVFYEDLEKFKDLKLIKTCILKHYAYGMKIDYQLAGKHMVRCEYGLNEKSVRSGVEKYKEPIKLCGSPFIPGKIPEEILEKYKTAQIRHVVNDVADLAGTYDEEVRKLLSGEIKVRDGREKALFYFIHILKKQMPIDDVKSKLKTWYSYSGGTKMTPQQIDMKVDYHWNKNYPLDKRYLKNNVLTD
jgi:hypothetical protein